MRKTQLSILLLLSIGCYAQGKANIRYFVRDTRLDFNSGSPVVLTDGQMNTLEGCATISNTAGQIFLYTDDVTVWDKNHQIMSNGTGLLGSLSSSQLAMIVPKPNSSTLCYVFTSDKFEQVNINVAGIGFFIMLLVIIFFSLEYYRVWSKYYVRLRSINKLIHL